MRLLFSLTKKDFEIETFCTGGPGGQHKNAKKNGVRIRHIASGAVAQEVASREQFLNKRDAFTKLAKSPVFLKWHKCEVARLLGSQIDRVDDKVAWAVDEAVDRAMAPENLRIEEY